MPTGFKPFMSLNVFERVVHAFITMHLDYCHALYAGISQASSSRLHLVQNAAACRLAASHKRDRISPILAALHWLPVHMRIEFTILLFVCMTLHGLAPSYIAGLLQFYSH